MSIAQATLAETPFWRYLAAAAILTDFAADKLRPMGGGAPDIVQVGAMLLDHGEPIRSGSAKGRWSLSGRSRASTLSELKRRGSLQDAANANREGDHPDNPTQRAIDQMIASRGPVRIRSQKLSDLLGYERAIDLLASAIETPADVRARVIAQIERLRLLEPLQRLLEHGFAGRKDEIEDLRRYVDAIDSKTFIEMLSRTADNVLDLFRVRPPLVIWGPGGVGKSTLIAKFLVEHAGAEQTKPTPFVYLDFDSGRLDPTQPDTLLAEALRQVQVQFPDFAGKAAELSADAETRLASEDGENIARGTQLQQSNQLRSRFADLMREIGKANDSKVLLFIDTFEVVQRRGITAVFNVIRLAAQLVQATPRIRPVIAGRVPIREEDFKSFTKNPPKWQPLPLEGFDAAAGRVFLQRHLKALDVKKLPPPEKLDRIVAIAGGNPLSLRLAAQVFARKGFDVLESAASQANFESSFSQERLQGLLHNRIIAALEPPLNKLADPGLIVRRITPEVIFRVLDKPCDLHLERLEDAEQLFQMLVPEVSLFEPLGVDTLRHRTDVRLLMLPVLRMELKHKATAIDEAAVEYWSGKDDADARAEAIYHSIWLDRDMSSLDEMYARGAVSKSLLEDALDEFEALDRSAEARVWLCAKLDRDISSELESKAGLAEWERHTERRARSLLQSGAASEALLALRARSDRSAASSLWFLEVQTLKLLGREKEALELIDRALEGAKAGGAPSHVLSLLLEKAWLFERTGDAKGALNYASQASALARSLNDDALIFQATLLRTRSARLSRSEQTGKLRDELARMMDNERITALLSSQPTLIGEAAAEIGDLRPELFILAAERQSIGGSDAAGEAASLIAAGVAYAERGDLVAAVEALERARNVSYRADDVMIQSRILFQLATVYYEEGRLEEAAARVQEARVLGDVHQNEQLQLMAWDALGSVRAAAGKFEDAVANYERSLAISRSTKNRRHQAATLAHLADAYTRLKKFEQSLQCVDESLSISREVGDQAGERHAQTTKAMALHGLGRLDGALEALERGLASAEAAESFADQIDILNMLAQLSLEAKDWGRAEGALHKALALGQRTGNAVATITTLENTGHLYAHTDRNSDALQAYQAQLALSLTIDDQAAIAAARRNIASILRLQGRDEEAREMLDAAEKLQGSAELPRAAHALDFSHDVSNARSAELLRSMEAAQNITDDLIHQTLKK